MRGDHNYCFAPVNIVYLNITNACGSKFLQTIYITNLDQLVANVQNSGTITRGSLITTTLEADIYCDWVNSADNHYCEDDHCSSVLCSIGVTSAAIKIRVADCVKSSNPDKNLGTFLDVFKLLRASIIVQFELASFQPKIGITHWIMLAKNFVVLEGIRTVAIARSSW